MTAIPPAKLLLTPQQFSSYATLALGSALALFMYPHSMTGLFSSNSANVIRRNAAPLPAYTILLFFMALLGFMALAAGIQPQAPYGAQWVVPGLFLQVFPSWFVGVAFSAIAIGALVPASIMSIAAANLFSRNIYREYLRPHTSAVEEARTAKLASLIVKVGALAFIVIVPLQYAINLQLLGGVWIIQTLPAVVLGLYVRWLNRWALLAGWAVGMLVGTLMAVSQNFASIFPLSVNGLVVPGYAAFWAFLANLAVTVAISLAILLVSHVRGLISPSRTNLEYTSV
jgi:SSS family solute:Na+ symporter